MGSLRLILAAVIFSCLGMDATFGLDPVLLEPVNSVQCPRIISRSEWGARSPRSTSTLSSLRPYAVVHHTDGSECYTESQCMSQVRGIQNYHMDYNGWDDIGYNFLIGGDGNVYEGRGWNNRGAHASSYNSYSVGISMIGTFTSSAPSSAMRKTMEGLLDCALSRESLIPGYTLFGHRQAVSTTCPGNALYSSLQSHPHYLDISGSVGNPLNGEQCSI